MTITDQRPDPPVAPARSTATWTARRVVAAALAGLALLLGTGLLVGGAVVAIASSALRGAGGYYTSSPATWSSQGYAAVSEDLGFPGGTMMPGMPARMMGTVRISVHAATGHPVFVGITPTSQLDRYLGGVASTTMTDPWDETGAGMVFHAGSAPAVPPRASPIWTASASGAGTQRVSWVPRSGHWTVVVMNVDGSAPVTSDVTVAAQLPGVQTFGVGLLVAGVVVFVGAGVGLVLAVPRSAPPITPTATPTPRNES